MQDPFSYTPEFFQRAIPLLPKEEAFIQKSRQTLQNIITQDDPRLLIILGPCSIHDPKSALFYADLVSQLAKEVQDDCFLVMRTYVEKQRTLFGWEGFIHDPYLRNAPDLYAGIWETRKLLLEIAKKEVPTACEFVDPLLSAFYSDLISWGSIGARTVSSSLHRQLASDLPMPIGIKNSLSGSIEEALYAMLSAEKPHTFLHLDPDGQVRHKRSTGNPYTHLVLRGGKEPNYTAPFVQEAQKKLSLQKLPSGIVIDCSHGNSQKKEERQKEVFRNILRQIEEGNSSLLGVMVESHLEGGNQPFSSSPLFGVSMTDPCLDWESTAELVREASSLLSSSKTIS